MEAEMKTRKLSAALALVLLSVMPSLVAAQASGGGGGANANSVTGTIVSVKGLTFVVSLADGTQKTVTLKDGALVLDRQVTTPDQIKAGDAVGVAATQDNNALTATSINIFAPEMWANMKEAQFNMPSGQIMTNAMTAQVAQNTQGRTLTLKMAMGNVTITVPDGIPVHRLVAVKPDQLIAGLKVTFRAMAAADGSLTASGASFDQPTTKG
jgi:hypothetical protein